jgi:hypothetical protein
MGGRCWLVRAAAARRGQLGQCVARAPFSRALAYAAPGRPPSDSPGACNGVSASPRLPLRPASGRGAMPHCLGAGARSAASASSSTFLQIRHGSVEHVQGGGLPSGNVPLLVAGVRGYDPPQGCRRDSGSARRAVRSQRHRQSGSQALTLHRKICRVVPCCRSHAVPGLTARGRKQASYPRRPAIEHGQIRTAYNPFGFLSSVTALSLVQLHGGARLTRSKGR